MSEVTERSGWWNAFRALPPGDPVRILAVALVVAVASALAVCIAAALLRPAHLANLDAERRSEIKRLLAATPGLADVLAEADYNRLEMRIIDLRLGDYARGIQAANFDAEAAAADPNLYTFIEEVDDSAGISRRPDLRPVWLARRNETLVLLVLPAYGMGNRSAIESLIALKSDLNTIWRLVITGQDETPVPGGGITDPDWLRQWQGKKVRDEAGTVRLDVMSGGGTGLYDVDTVDGDERSAEGVANLVRFWLGEHGFGPFLDRERRD